ncbi:hypothetical protein BDZ45DRAFT_690096 [Acephala macrosclerotiorum]|nr:hypothetical protein BDZ45DRAFT_690096 [Acephala macrosclerotiorum]
MAIQGKPAIKLLVLSRTLSTQVLCILMISTVMSPGTNNSPQSSTTTSTTPTAPTVLTATSPPSTTPTAPIAPAATSPPSTTTTTLTPSPTARCINYSKDCLNLKDLKLANGRYRAKCQSCFDCGDPVQQPTGRRTSAPAPKRKYNAETATQTANNKAEAVARKKAKTDSQVFALDLTREIEKTSERPSLINRQPAIEKGLAKKSNSRQKEKKQIVVIENEIKEEEVFENEKEDVDSDNEEEQTETTWSKEVDNNKK